MRAQFESLIDRGYGRRLGRPTGRGFTATCPDRAARREDHRSVDIDLRQAGSYEVWDAKITPDESVLAVQYVVRPGRLELMKGIPGDR